MTFACGKSRAGQSVSLARQVHEFGFAIQPNVLTAHEVQTCCAWLDPARAQDRAENVANSSGTYGLRNLTDVIPQTAGLVRHPKLARIVESVMGRGAFMTRATLFDKTPGANWGVFWHQDLSVAVQKKQDVPGFGAWTRKAGVDCVQPPAEIMGRVLAVRLHLDDCTARNGALKVLPGTHTAARLSTMEVEARTQQQKEVICEVPAGGVLLMRPLLLHASSPMVEATSRRVIHFEFASFALPDPLQWKYRIPCAPVSS